MKKLLLIAAASVAVLNGAANAATSSTSAIKPYVNIFAGYTTHNAFSGTNNSYSVDNQTTINLTRKHNHPFSLGVAAGSDLAQLSPNLSVGGELSFDYALTQPEANLSYTSASQTTSLLDIKVQHYAINPMAYFAFSPMQQLTIKGKAGVGYQHYGYKLDSEVDTKLNQNFSTGGWKPVVAAEVAYNINNRFGVIAGDEYTFGDKHAVGNLLDRAVNAEHTLDGSSIPSKNMIYVGGQVKF